MWAQLQNPVLARACNAKMLPQRLRERWQALGFSDVPTAVDAEPEQRKRQRMEQMRQRQQALMRRMQQQQKESVQSLDIEGEEDSVVEDAWQCATCREAGTADDPLTMLAAVGPFQGKSSHLGGSPGFPRFTSCRHMVHASCGEAHSRDVRSQGQGQHFFMDTSRGEFPCPMPVASQAVPLQLRAPGKLARPLRRCGNAALKVSQEVDAAAAEGALLRGACAELATAAHGAHGALAPGPPPPLYAALLRGAALLRYESRSKTPGQEVCAPLDEGQVLQRLAQPSTWLADPRVWCRLLIRGAAKASAAVVVQPGLLSVLACPPLDAVAVEVSGCQVAFYLVDSCNLQSTEIEDAERFRPCAPCCADLAARFAETSDAVFVPTLRCEEVPKLLEVPLAEKRQLFMWNSVLVVPDFLERSECHVFMDAADRAAASGSSAGKFYSNQPGLNRYPVRKLDLEAQMLSDSVIKDRLLPFLEQQAFARELFGHDRLSDLKAFFSPGEPAVNRYIMGGGIAPHIDREAVTLNVLLSEPGAFAGGGTAFWPQEEKTEEQEEKDVVILRPMQGTAILFNGQITHAGRAVSEGVRHAYVASFSLVSLE
ncbi:unnamed protein product [Effrenium voratum]|nr:unnamed protein product [Effrenium voratum]